MSFIIGSHANITDIIIIIASLAHSPLISTTTLKKDA